MWKRIRFYVGLIDKAGESVHSKVYQEIMDQFFIGYTCYNVQGTWAGEHEPSQVFEVLKEISSPGTAMAIEFPDFVLKVAQALRRAGNQSAVLVTVENIEEVVTVW